MPCRPPEREAISLSKVSERPVSGDQRQAAADWPPNLLVGRLAEQVGQSKAMRLGEMLSPLLTRQKSAQRGLVLLLLRCTGAIWRL